MAKDKRALEEATGQALMQLTTASASVHGLVTDLKLVGWTTMGRQWYALALAQQAARRVDRAIPALRELADDL